MIEMKVFAVEMVLLFVSVVFVSGKFFFFFFQAEDGIRDADVTGVQTCALPIFLWQAHAGLAGVWLAAGDWDRARRSFEAGIEVVEQSQSQLNGPDHKITFLARLIRFYQDYVDALMDRNLPLRALEVADSSRARILSEGLFRKENLADRVHSAAELQEL